MQTTKLKLRITFLFTVVLISMAFQSARAQEKPLYEIQAAIIYNVVKFTQWANESEGKEFVMGVYGDENLYGALKTAYQNKSKGAKKIVINNLSSLDEVLSCDLFFLGDKKLKDFPKAKELATNKPILCVTGAPSYGKKGSAVNLTTVDNRMVIEINEQTISQGGFKVSGTLLTMAKVIK